jgi:hypothetical protein
MRTTNNRRFIEIMAGLFLLIAGVNALLSGAENVFFIGMAIGGLYLLAKQFDQSRKAPAAPRGQRYSVDDLFAEDEEEQPLRQSGNPEQVYAHALRAVKTAGLDPEQIHVLPVDIGVMVYNQGESAPEVYRTRALPDDIDYVQPFVQLRLPSKANGRIRFEILDTDGKTVYVHEDYHQLKRGRNLVIPGTRLPIHDEQSMSGDWQIRVTADNVVIAIHEFGWRESIRAYLTEDGEISSELRAALSASNLQKMSLDELLASQEEEAQQRRG